MSTAGAAARAILKAGSRRVPSSAAAAAAAGSVREGGGVVAGVGKRGVASAVGLHQNHQNHHHQHQQQQRFYQQHGFAIMAGSAFTLLSLSLAMSEPESLEDILPSFLLEKLHHHQQEGPTSSGAGAPPAASFARIEEYYTMESDETLGRGQFGTVSTATDKATGEVVAVKCVPRTKASEAHFRQEADVHREASSHPNVVGLKGVFADEDCWYMVMELAEGGELFDRLTTEGLVLGDGEVRSLLRDTAEAIAYLHDHSIVHGDVKPENMLLTAPTVTGAGTGENQAAAAAVLQARERAEIEGGVGSEVVAPAESEAGGDGGAGMGEVAAGGAVGNVLLADFGSSFRMEDDDASGGSEQGSAKRVKEYTVAYSAPEVVTNSPVDQKVDVWSLGVIAYVMVKGHHPFDPTSLADDDEIADSILHSEPDWDGVEPKAASLIRQMLSRNPEDRPSAREVLQNAWLQQLQ